MNVWGLFAVNNNTFNHYDNGLKMGEGRKIQLTFYKVHNLVLNVLGYIPIISILSGMARMGSGFGVTILSVFFLINDKNDRMSGYDREMLLTGIAQQVRGALEVIVPFGWAVNAGLDFGATFYNMKRHSKHAAISSEDPDYPHVFKVLHLV